MEDKAIHGQHGVMEPLSRGIGRFVSGLDVAALRPSEVTALRFTVADCLASALAGAEAPATKAAIAILADNYGGNGTATILGHRDRTTALAAAMVNGTMAHACDFDDVSEPMCGHPTAPALPAILALAEIRGRSGSDVLVALAAALEVMTKLGRIAGYELYRSGWHPTATLGVFGAAAGAAKILGLDAERTATAISIAASRASGVRANIGTTVKPLHCGFSARDGLECALLASAGATANAHALEGPNGFLKAFTPQHDDIQALVESLGNPFDISEPGIDFKKYQSCWDTDSGIEWALYLRKTYSIEPADVKAIRCALAPGMGADLVYPQPSTPLQGKFSDGILRCHCHAAWESFTYRFCPSIGRQSRGTRAYRCHHACLRSGARKCRPKEFLRGGTRGYRPEGRALNEQDGHLHARPSQESNESGRVRAEIQGLCRARSRHRVRERSSQDDWSA